MGEISDWPAIIEQAAKSGLGIAALVILMLGALALLFFRRAPVPWRGFVFLVLLFGTGSFVFAVYRFVPDQGLSERPTVFMMDSTLHRNIYECAGLDANECEKKTKGDINADVIYDILADLPIVRWTEKTGLNWNREEDILQSDPDLIIIHFSAFEPATYTLENSRSGSQKFSSFLKYMSTSKTKFIIYSRIPGFNNENFRQSIIADAKISDPNFLTRIQILDVSAEPRTFTDPEIARRLKLLVKEILEID